MSKDLEEKLEELKKVGAGYRAFYQSKEVVEALKIHGELMYELIKSTRTVTYLTLVLIVLTAVLIVLTYFIIQLS